MGIQVYQSVKGMSIRVTGTGFKSDVSLVLEPDLKEGTDYSATIESKNSIVLGLKPGKKWRSEAGFILAKAVKVGGKSFNLGGNDGIRIATVLADPVVSEGKENYHETQVGLIHLCSSTQIGNINGNNTF